MKRFLVIVLILMGNNFFSFSQSVEKLTNAEAENILKGNYDPSDYYPGNEITGKEESIKYLVQNISPDSLKNYLEILGSFYNRNTCSDTVSQNYGIGATRRWIHRKFRSFSTRNGHRLVTSYLEFVLTVKDCPIDLHKNVVGVLPGRDINSKEIIIIEGHMDSRCDNRWDGNCEARGVDDNGSGTALVIELARVMSRLSPDHTIVFMATTGEEQGLIGANAFLNYVQAKKIPVKAVQNNDIVGGIICGETASPPGCPGEGEIDSSNLRIYSQGVINSPNKGYARFVHLEFEEELKPMLKVPYNIRIMNLGDRTGRGGDHLPFSGAGITAIRFTSANEHGHGDPSEPGYSDHQHTSEDVMGVDTDNDGIIDSFFVDFNYLRRNALINGVSALMAAEGPETPEIKTVNDANGITVEITSQHPRDEYRIGIRTTNSNYFRWLYTIKGKKSFLIPETKKDTFYFIQVASVNDLGIESLFSEELFEKAVGNGPAGLEEGSDRDGISILPVRSNPYDETLTVLANNETSSNSILTIRLTSMSGKELAVKSATLKAGMNEITFPHGVTSKGVFLIRFFIDGTPSGTGKVIFN